MRHLLLLGALLGAASAASGAPGPARERPFYAGIDLGEARLHRNWPDFYSSPRRDRASTAWKLRFGYQWSAHVSLEAAFTDFGDYEGSGMVVLLPEAPADPPLIFAPGDYRTSAKGIDVSALFTWPIGERFYANASTGIARREMKSRHDASLPHQRRFTARDGDVAAQFGAGFGVRIGEALDLGLNWVRTRELAGDIEYLENAADPAMISLGLRVRF